VQVYDEKLKNLVIAEFLAGNGVMALSRKHSVPKSTLQGWIKVHNHTHRWMIASPSGPTSEGKCKICKEVRDFRNSLDVTNWTGSPSHKKTA